MSFTPEQIKALEAPLPSSHVKTRSQAGRQLSYIEGWKAIEEANRIFGFDAWSSQIMEVTCVSESARKVGRDQKDGWGVTYNARVRVTVQAGDRIIICEGSGTGHGIDVDLGQAHESALKESETDARKRALMTFGNPFGLALYDKEQRNVSDEVPAAEPKREARSSNTPLSKELEPDPDTREAITYTETALKVITAFGGSPADLKAWWQTESGKRREYGLSQAQVDILKGKLMERIAALTPEVAA